MSCAKTAQCVAVDAAPVEINRISVSALVNEYRSTQGYRRHMQLAYSRANGGVQQGQEQDTKLTSDPPLGSSQMRRMDDKLVRPFVQRGGRLQSGDVGAVSQFYQVILRDQ
jgi:hypothetical protein